MHLLRVAAALVASVLQVARNGLQRSVMGVAGPWGATLVRFMFGLPFSAMLAGACLVVTPAMHPRFSGAFWIMAATGAAAQLSAAASLLVAMRRAGFAVGTALQQSSLPLAAVFGAAVFHDRLGAWAWVGVGVTTFGLAALTWPRHAHAPRPISGAALGLLSGLAFGLSLNAFRHAGLALDPRHPIVSAVTTVVVVQAMQTGVLGGALLALDRNALLGGIRGWRRSLAAGLCGAGASTGWFVALVLAPAASVRAVGVVEAPIAAFAGHRMFGERLQAWQLAAGGAVAIGVALTTLG